MKFYTLDDVDLKGKSVLLRVDINSPYDEKKKSIRDSEKIKEPSRTIKELSIKGVKTVVIAHQGRKGDPDFTDLSCHAKLLEKHSGRKVQFVDDICGPKAIEKIKNMKNGEVILLDNVRKLDEETAKLTPEQHAQSNLVKTLSPLFDYFVQDGFSVCHRSQASVVGFPLVLKTIVGRVFEKEMTALEKIDIGKEATYVLGGAKPEEDMMVLKHASKSEKSIVLTGGIFGLYCSAAKGIDLGKNMEKLDPKIIEEIMPLMTGQVIVPEDYIDENGKKIASAKLPCNKLLLDIGPKTSKKYAEIIKKSKVIFGKGPMGKYEDKKFSKGTVVVLKAIAGSKGFSLIGGGNTTDAISRFKIPKKKFGHISLAGGALLEYMAGEKLPGLEVLKKWEK